MFPSGGKPIALTLLVGKNESSSNYILFFILCHVPVQSRISYEPPWYEGLLKPQELRQGRFRPLFLFNG